MVEHRGNRRFRPGLVPTIAVLVSVPLCLMLGNWQLDRAQQKRELGAQMQRPSRVALAQVAARQEAADDGFLPVLARGRYLAQAPQVLLEAMPHDGRSGYHVLSPLRLAEGGVLVLVDRGWIARDFASPVPPDVAPPATGETEVAGLLTPLPRPGLRLAPSSPVAAPAREETVVPMLYPDAQALEALYGEPVFDGVVLLAPEAPGGFVRDWNRRAGDPMKHVGYAVQWFAFAFTALVLYAVLNFRRAGGSGEGTEPLAGARRAPTAER